MLKAIRKFLHDEIATLLDIPPSGVVWANQTAPKQSNPMVTLMLYSQQAEEMPNYLRNRSEPEEVDTRVSTEFVLEVQFYGKQKTYPVDILESLIRQMERPTVVDSFFANGVAFLYADPVQDLTGLLGNDQQFEPRAAVDLHCRYTAQTIDDPGYIDEVDATIDIEGRIEVTGKLIHGNLIRGEEPDLEHALDVDFSCSAKE